jgi:predicted TIM-barrel fold metal-dependent hydrolase
MFEDRLPRLLQHAAPHIVIAENGAEEWEFDGRRFSQAGVNAVAGRHRGPDAVAPLRFDEMRQGCWDVNARVADMDLNGIWASMNFPSMITGFCGRVFSECSDRQLGKAVTRAWNDWFFNEWYSQYPRRLIPLGITYLSDADEGAREIRRHAARGFRAVSLPERPHRIGLPSLFTDYWDPIVRACADTGTVICLHVGSSGIADLPAGCPGLQLAATLFGQLSLTACAEWLWSGYAHRMPNVKIAMSEGGIGWVAMLIDRLENLVERAGYDPGWGDRPADILRRNFWFCTLDDPSTIDTRAAIGINNIMVEVDYPHGDTTWPDTQHVIHEAWGHLPPREIRAMCSQNAADLFRHPLPDYVLPEIPLP